MSCDSRWLISHFDIGFMVSCWCLESYTGRNVTFMLVISSPLCELLGFLFVFAVMLYAFTPCFLLTDLQLHVMSKFSTYSIFSIHMSGSNTITLFSQRAKKNLQISSVQIYISLRWQFVLFYISVLPSATLTIPRVLPACCPLSLLARLYHGIRVVPLIIAPQTHGSIIWTQERSERS